MKKILSLLVVALLALTFAVPVMAEEKTVDEKPADAKVDKKKEKKEKKDKKKDATKDEKKKEGEAKPAAKGKKEVSGC